MIDKLSLNVVSSEIRSLPENMTVFQFFFEIPPSWTASYSYAQKYTLNEGQELAWARTIEHEDLQLPKHLYLLRI